MPCTPTDLFTFPLSDGREKLGATNCTARNFAVGTISAGQVARNFERSHFNSFSFGTRPLRNFVYRVDAMSRCRISRLLTEK